MSLGPSGSFESHTATASVRLRAITCVSVFEKAAASVLHASGPWLGMAGSHMHSDRSNGNHMCADSNDCADAEICRLCLAGFFRRRADQVGSRNRRGCLLASVGYRLRSGRGIVHQ